MKKLIKVDAATILALAAQEIDKNGFHKSAEGDASTAAAVRAIIGDGLELKIETRETDAIRAWVDAQNAIYHSDYMVTLYECLHYAEDEYGEDEIGIVEDWMVGFLVSAVASYRRAMARNAEMEKAAEGSNWLGKEGDKVKFTVASVRELFDSSADHRVWGARAATDYAKTLLIKDTEGNSIVWRCRYEFITNNGISDYAGLVGKTVIGKVKQNNEYNGAKQSRVWYCKIA